MNDCIAGEFQEMLPDLLHGSLKAGERERLEQHLAACETCREELAVLRTVKDATVFAPAIDVTRIVRQIPPYRQIVPTKAPSRTRVASWLTAAAAAVLIIGGGSVMINRSTPLASVDDQNHSTDVALLRPTPTEPRSDPRVATAAPQPAPAHNFALASDVASLSDGDLVQLMTEMDDFDALPAAEPDPVIAVDGGDSL